MLECNFFVRQSGIRFVGTPKSKPNTAMVLGCDLVDDCGHEQNDIKNLLQEKR